MNFELLEIKSLIFISGTICCKFIFPDVFCDEYAVAVPVEELPPPVKKICFVYLKRTNGLERYEIIPVSLHPDFDELISSFKLFTKFELVDLNSIDSNTSLFITFQSFDANEMGQYDFVNSFLLYALMILQKIH